MNLRAVCSALFFLIAPGVVFALPQYLTVTQHLTRNPAVHGYPFTAPAYTLAQVRFYRTSTSNKWCAQAKLRSRGASCLLNTFFFFSLVVKTGIPWMLFIFVTTARIGARSCTCWTASQITARSCCAGSYSTAPTRCPNTGLYAWKRGRIAGGFLI